MGKWLTFTFALTGRREWGHGTQGVALGWGLAGLSARAGPQTGLFPHNLHPPNISILSTLPFQGRCRLSTNLDFLDFKNPTPRAHLLTVTKNETEC